MRKDTLYNRQWHFDSVRRRQKERSRSEDPVYKLGGRIVAAPLEAKSSMFVCLELARILFFIGTMYGAYVVLL